jgi:hypothetical protein
MKNMTTIKLAAMALAALLITSCASTQDFLKALGPPSQVQYEITQIGALAKPRITDQKVLDGIHKFGVDLQQAGNLDTSQLVALIPHTGNPSADALIAAAVSFVNSAIAKFGAHNQTTLAYIQAAANGVLANF